jgi:hypothetical protein
MGLLSLVMLAAVLVAQAAELPSPFPRPGTTKLLENDVVAVWNVSWLKQKYPPAGTVHAGPAPGAGARAYIFEVK